MKSIDLFGFFLDKIVHTDWIHKPRTRTPEQILAKDGTTTISYILLDTTKNQKKWCFIQHLKF